MMAAKWIESITGPLGAPLAGDLRDSRVLGLVGEQGQHPATRAS